MGRDVRGGGVFKRTRHGIRILSILTTWALENAIDTADSMKSRGYGLPGRTAFSIYRFDKRDARALLFLLFCGGAVIIGAALGGLKFIYYPAVSAIDFSVWQTVLFAAYAGLCAMPILLKLRMEN